MSGTSLEYGLATVVRNPERFPTIVDPSRYTGNPVRLDRYTDGADAVPVGERRMHKLGTRVDLIPADLVDDYRALEMYQIRTSPDRFEGWYADMHQDARANMVEAMDADVHDWDCHGCKRAVLAPVDAVRCPTCGATS